MTNQELIELIKLEGINNVLKRALGEGFPFDTKQVLEIYWDYKHLI
jgi:hypothetical protein